MTSKLGKEIQAEQDHGRQKYGRGPHDFGHDDAHTQGEWRDFIYDQIGRLMHSTPMEYRQALVKVAGLAISAIEAFDRKRKIKRKIK